MDSPFDEASSSVRIVLLLSNEDRGGLGSAAWLVFGLLLGAGVLCVAIALQAIRYVARSEEKLRYDAYHDALTGLANRRLFLSSLDDAFLARSRNPEREFAVVYIDLNKFKVINDTLGHEAGDLVLVETAKRISECTRTGDIAARLGGDEFAILLTRVGAAHTDAMRVVHRLRERVALAIDYNGTTVRTSASVGICFAEDKYGSADEIMREADAGAYREKAQGRLAGA